MMRQDCVVYAVIRTTQGEALHGLPWRTASGAKTMSLNVEILNPLVALIAGILILLMPRLLNYIVAIYLIVIGLLGLSHHFHFHT